MTTTPGEFGELVLGPVENGAFRVIRADPRVRLPGWLARQGLGDHFAPGLKLTIAGVDRRVIYVVGEYHADEDWYEAQWPD